MLTIKKLLLIGAAAIVGIFILTVGYGLITDCPETAGYVDCSGL